MPGSKRREAEMSTRTKYMTGAEVAAMFRTSPETVRYWKYVGKGPKFLKVGRRVLYAVEDVEAWASDARSGGVAA